MIAVPTIDSIVDAALNPENPVRVIEKKASRTMYDEADEIEKIADDLDKWAADIRKNQEDHEKQAEENNSKKDKEEIFKLAAIDTIYKTLQSLENNGQIERLLEKEVEKRPAFTLLEKIQAT